MEASFTHQDRASPPDSFSKLRVALNPQTLTIHNDSAKHAGHIGNPSGDPNAETHFHVTCISEKFEGVKLIQRHRLVQDLLAEELKAGLHALSLQLHAPSEKKA